MNKLLLGLLVAGTALGASAYKNASVLITPINGKALPAGYFVQASPDNYEYRSPAATDDGTCLSPANRICSYSVPQQNSIPSTGPYTEAQLLNFNLSPAGSARTLWIEEEQ